MAIPPAPLELVPAVLDAEAEDAASVTVALVMVAPEPAVPLAVTAAPDDADADAEVPLPMAFAKNAGKVLAEELLMLSANTIPLWQWPVCAQ